MDGDGAGIAFLGIGMEHRDENLGQVSADVAGDLPRSGSPIKEGFEPFVSELLRRGEQKKTGEGEAIEIVARVAAVLTGMAEVEEDRFAAVGGEE